MSTVTLAGKEHEVILPTRFAERKELCGAWVNNRIRGAAALVGFCVPSLNVGISFQLCDYNPYEYGAQVLDRLAAMGISDVDMVAASVSIFNALSEGLYPTDPEVVAAVDFTGRSAGDPTT